MYILSDALYELNGGSFSDWASITAIVVRPQAITFTGTNVASGDKVKWVRLASLTDGQCGAGSTNAQGGVGEVTVGASGTANVTTTGSMCHTSWMEGRIVL
jgi:hypothetical protein